MEYVAFLDQTGNKLNEINNIIFSSSTNTITTMFANWPNMVGAFGILVVGWLFSSIIEKVLTNIVNRLNVDQLFKRFNFQDILDQAQIKSSPVIIVVKFLKSYIFMMFFLAAAKLLKFDYIAIFLNSVIDFLPRLAVALLIVLFGFSIADTTAAFLRNALRIADIKSALLLSSMAKYVIITFSILAALMQIDIAPNFLNILFIGVVGALSLGIGLSFGIGGSKFIADRLEEFSKKHHKKLLKEHKIK